MALLMNDAFDRDREEQRIQAEQAQRERDERLKQEAAEQARRDAENKHKAELEAAARREAEEKARAELAERQRIEAERVRHAEKQEADARAERGKIRSSGKLSAARLRKKPIASAARQSNENRPDWQRRSAKLTSRRGGKPTLSTVRLSGTDIVKALQGQYQLNPRSGD
ncbi:Uncharacterised protein [Raoultella planticola]|uniref:Uncharacterized protein n=1 Tax=Raoultella planticola TaxID=575 RepID=A0A485ABQ6_RAOPL|nr:Uncharacterised protein [Raoultella planticola]